MSASGSLAALRAAHSSGGASPACTSRREARERSMSRHTRATIVVSQPPRFSTSPAPERLTRAQASWTASSASVLEPSIRKATRRRGLRFFSKCSVSQLLSVIVDAPSSARLSAADSWSHFPVCIRQGHDGPNTAGVTRPAACTGKLLDGGWTNMQSRMKNPAMIIPEAMAGIQALQVATTKGELPAKTLALVHLRASQINGCAPCIEGGSREAKQGGESDER